MAIRYFVMISTDPELDPRKCVVGIACAAQAAKEGHEVHTFFASHAVRLLQTEYITKSTDELAKHWGIAVPIWTH